MLVRKYVKNKKPRVISPLLNKDGFLHSRSTSKKEIQNDQFQENLSNIPDIGHSNIPSTDYVIISKHYGAKYNVPLSENFELRCSLVI